MTIRAGGPFLPSLPLLITILADRSAASLSEYYWYYVAPSAVEKNCQAFFPFIMTRCQGSSNSTGRKPYLEMFRLNCLLLSLLFFHQLATASAAGLTISREDIIRTDVEEYETSLGVDDFTDNFVVPYVDLAALGLKIKGDALLKAGKFEGDIAGFAGAKTRAIRKDLEGVAHNAVRDVWHRWVDAEIPYVLSSRYGSYSRKVIAKSMDEFHKKTCIRFVPKEMGRHRDYVYIEPDDGCYSMVGRMGGKQPLSLDAGCMEVGIIVHELMHTAGFFHEQSRTDRDQYIRINWRNIVTGAHDQFDKYDTRTSSLLGAKYDYNSIMHYGPYAFSRNGQKTIEPLQRGGESMGQRGGFSQTDLYKLNKLYNCKESEREVEPTTVPAIAERRTTSRPEVTKKKLECVNKKWECYFWKWLNHCTTNKQYMMESCRKACGWCETQEEVDPTPSTVDLSTSVESSKCEDTNGHCERWSKGGFCDRIGYRHFMAATCPLSCGKCYSSDYANAAEENTGRKSTELSDYDVAIKSSASTISCTDSAGFKARCALYTMWGMCSGKNGDFMRKLCPQSCGLCK